MARFDPGLNTAAKAARPPHIGGVARYTHAFDFDDQKVGRSAEDLARRQQLAMMMAAKDRAERPVCMCCKKHKVARVGKGLGDPMDTLCGICSRISAQHGPRKAETLHRDYCGSCQKKDCTRCKLRKVDGKSDLCRKCGEQGNEGE